MPVGVLVELEENDWLIDWSAEVMLPTLLPIHEPLLQFKIPINKSSFSSLESLSSTILSSLLPSQYFSKSVSAPNIPLLFIPPEPAIPSTLPLLAPLSPTVPYNLDPPWDFVSPALAWHVDSLALPHPSKPSAPPQTVYQLAPPWLLALTAPPGTVVPSSPLGFFVPLAPPGSVVATPSPWTSGGVCCAPSLHPYSSVWLLHPTGFTRVLAHTCVTSVHRPPGSSSLSPPWSPWCPFHVARSPCVTSVGQAQVSSLAPPSIISAMGHPHLGCLLLCSGLSSAAYSAMDSSICSSMDCSTICSSKGSSSA
ncbi:vegetative cell wall gp1-like protein [Labeo rohita]|uniref:Vegetative cell wall gp1-like protein n=1 Tax=Labeo rohita TaxID=84645 RepID=A0A498NB51_LABRO|nr:vegetative cell wall gp1-like protein [Labeo rohita]RXN26077.1 vegetative cell wall gp1-like protein [Labeo rohita]